MEQARLVKALEPDVEWARGADRDVAVWAVRLPRARVGNACVRNAERRPPMWRDSPATK